MISLLDIITNQSGHDKIGNFGTETQIAFANHWNTPLSVQIDLLSLRHNWQNDNDAARMQSKSNAPLEPQMTALMDRKGDAVTAVRSMLCLEDHEQLITGV